MSSSAWGALIDSSYPHRSPTAATAELFCPWIARRLPNKLKILIGFYQIAGKVEAVYEIYLPTEVRALLQQIRIIISLGIEGVPLRCMKIRG